ncbi:hypothetical protein VKT23_013000 [Stygiomarasmius scandens]|uniref:Uncharacterized protein n=1 Tax=Marasmiellus scandens TaxID=2682957 RepID=A0ABR1J8W6_9AGAR
MKACHLRITSALAFLLLSLSAIAAPAKSDDGSVDSDLIIDLNPDIAKQAKTAQKAMLKDLQSGAVGGTGYIQFGYENGALYERTTSRDRQHYFCPADYIKMDAFKSKPADDVDRKLKTAQALYAAADAFPVHQVVLVRGDLPTDMDKYLYDMVLRVLLMNKAIEKIYFVKDMVELRDTKKWKRVYPPKWVYPPVPVQVGDMKKPTQNSVKLFIDLIKWSQMKG